MGTSRGETVTTWTFVGSGLEADFSLHPAKNTRGTVSRDKTLLISIVVGARVEIPVSSGQSFAANFPVWLGLSFDATKQSCQGGEVVCGCPLIFYPQNRTSRS